MTQLAKDCTWCSVIICALCARLLGLRLAATISALPSLIPAGDVALHLLFQLGAGLDNAGEVEPTPHPCRAHSHLATITRANKGYRAHPPRALIICCALLFGVQAFRTKRQMPAWQCCQISRLLNTARKTQGMRPHRDDSLMASLNMQLEAYMIHKRCSVKSCGSRHVHCIGNVGSSTCALQNTTWVVEHLAQRLAAALGSVGM